MFCHLLAAPCSRLHLPLLQVVEDVEEGPVVAGLRTRVAKSAEELRAVFNLGRANRDMQVRACCTSGVDSGGPSRVLTRARLARNRRAWQV